MAETAPRLLTVDEFLAWDDGTDRRYQLLRGVITMMAPPPVIHGGLVSRLDRLLGSQLRPPCEPLTGVGIKPQHRSDAYYLADLAVTCRPIEPGESHLREPVVVVEVLASSSAATDRLEKLDDYRMVPSIADILLVASTRSRSSIGTARATSGSSRRDAPASARTLPRWGSRSTLLPSMSTCRWGLRRRPCPPPAEIDSPPAIAIFRRHVRR